MTPAASAARFLARRRHELATRPVVVGFDGFVDETVQVVDERRGPGDCTPIPTLAGIGAWMSACSGRNGLRELVVRRQDAGGCAVNLGDGLIALGLGVDCFATIGRPRHPAFDRFAAACRSCTAWGDAYGRTMAFECRDGKAMLSVVEPLARLDAAAMEALLADGAYARACTGAAAIALTDWSLFPHMTTCWEVLDRQIFARLPRRPRLFVDLVDPGNRTRADIAAMLAMLGRFQHHAAVTLGLNLTEAAVLGRILGTGPVQAGPGLGDNARLLRTLLAIDQVVIHSARWNAVAEATGVTVQPAAAFCDVPVRTTGAGDRFNAGYVCALALDLPAAERLAVASAVASTFIRTGTSPDLDAVITALGGAAGADMPAAETDMACGAACV